MKVVVSRMIVSSLGVLISSAAAIAFMTSLGATAPSLEEERNRAPLSGKGQAVSGCLAADCHQGIEDIMDPDSGMMRSILERGRAAGDPAGCVVCHGGDPEAKEKDVAHRGSPEAIREASGARDFYPDPGSPWINEYSCGTCHEDHVNTQWQSLMMTEAGKIQGTTWAFGSLEGYEAKWGNYDVENPGDPELRLGTDTYKAYMEELRRKEPGAFPEKMETLPAALEDLSELSSHPEKAVFTYIRNQCQRCHLGVRGRPVRGGYRGMGCSACHIPYGNEGNYEGSDASVERDKPRHLLVHTIQSTRDKTVRVNGKSYSGIPVETCTTCHDRGKRIGVTYQGLMESAYESPYIEGGEGQLALHTKHYIAMQEDIHYRKGMLCIDCHTSIDVHGDGFLTGSNLAQVQIECADCHGTADAYPWELPIGFQDEFGPPSGEGDPRGVARELEPRLTLGKVYPPEDGYLLTARGNPFPEVVRRGEKVVVHTAGGADIELKPLKLLAREAEMETAAKVAMVEVDRHIDSMECYSCHAGWAPQCYGCHVKIDYSEGKECFDWVAAGHRHGLAEHSVEAGESGYDTIIPGRIDEQRSYMRFEDPPLGINGEGRVSPLAPGCQPSVTIIGPGGETVLLNHIFRTLPGSEGSGPEGQLGIDMSPTNPHTSGQARSCESCHLSAKALGYGIEGGRFTRGLDSPVYIDLMTAEGEVIPESARPQIEPIAGLEADWSRFVTEDGRQLQTVGHHFSLSRPLDNDERARIDRAGVCLSCHSEIPRESLAVSLLHHVAEAADLLPKSAAEHESLVRKILLLSAWTQAGGGIVFGAALAVGLVWFYRRMRKRRQAAKAC